MASPSEGTFRIAVTAVAIGAASLIAYRAYSKSSSTKEEETWESHCTGHGDLQEIWPSTLYIVEAKGCEMGPPTRNMVIYKVPSSSEKLVIYNGIAVNDTLLKQIQVLGTPTVLVVPNYYHRCCAAVWKKKFPNLFVVCPEAAREHAQKVVEVDATTEEWAEMPEWKDWIHAKTIDGWGDFETVLEVELEDKKKTDGKKAVLVCDLLFTVPYEENTSLANRFAVWMFDSSIELPPDGEIIVPKVARISRVFAIKDWEKAEQWYRVYAREHGKSVAAIVVGHGVVVKEIDPELGCTEAFIGVANQLSKPRW